MNLATKTRHELLEDFRDAVKNYFDTKALGVAYGPETYKVLEDVAHDRLKEVLRRSEVYFCRFDDGEE